MFDNPEVTAELAKLAVAVMSLVVTALTAWIGPKVAALVGQKTQEKHAKMLHEAAMTWAETAVTRGVSQANGAALDSFLAYAQRSIPDALKSLNPGAEVLQAIIGRYLAKALPK